MLPDASGLARPADPTRTAPSMPWRRAMEWTLVALVGSGVVWLAARYLLAAPTPYGPQLPSWAPRALAVHGALAMLSLLAIGAWIPVHVLPRLRRHERSATGYAQLGMLTVLTITGFSLYYVADETSRPAWSAAHWLAGLAFGAMVLIHRRRGNAARLEPDAAAGQRATSDPGA